MRREVQAGNVPGFAHLYRRQEAVAVGARMNLIDTDYIGSIHRSHGALKTPVLKESRLHTLVPAPPHFQQQWIPSIERIEKTVQVSLAGQDMASSA